MVNIAIIVGSTRPQRFADHPARWIYAEARKREDLHATVLDLREYPLPFYQEAIAPIFREGPPDDPALARWSTAVAQADGFVIVTPEYNHSFPAVLKNALDHAYKEWNHKPVAFVGYGGLGGARAVEQLRLVAVELQMMPLKHTVHIPVQAYVAVAQQGQSLSSFDYLQTGAASMLDQLVWWSRVLKSARAQG